MVVRNALQIVGSLVFMFALNAALTGVLLSVIPIVSRGSPVRSVSPSLTVKNVS